MARCCEVWNYRRRTRAALAATAVLLVAPLIAAETADDSATQTAAETLFIAGRKLMAEGNVALACERFAESRRLEPAIGTTLNLARCYKNLGRSASAWLLYREAAAAAHAAGQDEREEIARLELSTLEQELARLQIELPPALQADPRVAVMLDGAALPPSVLGSPYPVDPGARTLLVVVNGERLWSTDVQASARETIQVAIPELRLPLRQPKREVSATAARLPPLLADDTTSTAGGLGTRRIAALGFAGASVVAGGYALFETFRAQAAYDRSHPSSCSLGENNCTDRDLHYRELAFDRAHRVDIAAGVSVACLASAAVLWVFGAEHEPRISATTSRTSFMLSYQEGW